MNPRIQAFAEFYAEHSDNAVGLRFGLTRTQVRQEARRMALQKSDEYKRKNRARRGDRCGALSDVMPKDEQPAAPKEFPLIERRSGRNDLRQLNSVFALPQLMGAR